MTSSFLVIGAGAWGTALAYELARKKHHVLLWTRHSEHAQALRLDRENKKYLPGYRFPTEIEITEDLIQAVQKVDRVLIAVPSHGFEEILAKIAPHFPKNKGILSSTKGLDPKSGRFLSELISDYLGKDSPQALLTGPSFATEIVRAFPTEVTLATNQLNFAHALKQELDHPHFHFKISEDLIGAQVGGAVKNVVSIVIGLAEGLGYGMNTKAMLITKGLAEMMSIARALGAKPETLLEPCGIGDLFLTASGNESRNRRFGLMLGEGLDIESAMHQIGQVVEGVTTAFTLKKLSDAKSYPMPMTRILCESLENPKMIPITIERLLKI